MTESSDPVRPLEPALKPLLLPEVVAKLSLGAKVQAGSKNAIVSFDGSAIQLALEDLEFAKKVSERVRKKLPAKISPGVVIDAILLSQQYVSEELFRPGAARVLFYSTLSKASAFYRCLMPSYALGQGTRCTSHVSGGKYTRAALEYDVIVFQIDHSPGARQFAKSMKDAGKKIVYEIDDAFDCMEPWHSSYASFGAPERQESIREMMRLADAVQVSTQWLADRYRPICKRIEVIPNLMELSAWPIAPKLRKDDLFKILWAGSPSHHGDIVTVLPSLQGFLGRHPDARLVMFGYELRELGQVKGQVENIPWCEFVDYAFKLSEIDADISIAPLADVPFNYGKSNLRILQMWATGYPVIASTVGAYNETITPGRDGILCDSDQEWMGSLELLYQNRGAAKALVSAGLESVKRWDVHPNIAKVEDFYASLSESR